MKIYLKTNEKISQKVFILFCALNIFGYNEENNDGGMHPIRKKVRKILEQKNDWNEKYPLFLKIIKQNHPWRLLNLLISNKPKFKRNLLDHQFIKYIKQFSNEPEIKKAQKAFKEYYKKETLIILPKINKEADKLFQFSGQFPKRINKMFLIINLLDAYWRGYQITDSKNAYIVVGPGAEKNHCELIRHELLHLIANKFKININVKISAELKKLGYNNKKIINEEFIVRAINFLYDKIIIKKP